jgi:hypothetical protein
MSENTNIFGCFVSSNIGDGDGDLFRSYIWGDKGVCNTIKKLNHQNYGKDLVLILFQFYINPIPFALANIKSIESYRKKEKAIGLPIIVTKDNFFCKSEEDRHNFIKQAFFEKLELLSVIIIQKKLDTKIDLLKSDLQKSLFY